MVEGLPPLQTYDNPAMVASTGGRPGEVSESRNANGFTLARGRGRRLVLLLAVLLIILL